MVTKIKHPLEKNFIYVGDSWAYTNIGLHLHKKSVWDMHYNKNPLINQICEQFNTDGIKIIILFHKI